MKSTVICFNSISLINKLFKVYQEISMYKIANQLKCITLLYKKAI